MPYVRDSFWRGREFASLEGMQAEAARWSAEVAGRRACRPLEGAARPAVFEAVERDALRPLPAGPFVLATWATAKIGPDIHAQVDKVLYSVPWRHIGKTADVRITGCDGAVLHRRPAGQVPSPQGPGEADRLRGLPAGEDRVPHADPGLVPQAGRRDRPVVRAADRRAARRQRPLPAPRRPGRHRPGRQARSGQARGGLREGHHGRGPVLPHGAGHPRRRRGAGPAPGRGRGRRGTGVPARPCVVRERHPHARHGHQRRRHPGDHRRGAPS